jgi:hypothetical protein
VGIVLGEEIELSPNEPAQPLDRREADQGRLVSA